MGQPCPHCHILVQNHQESKNPKCEPDVPGGFAGFDSNLFNNETNYPTDFMMSHDFVGWECRWGSSRVVLLFHVVLVSNLQLGWGILSSSGQPTALPAFSSVYLQGLPGPCLYELPMRHFRNLRPSPPGSKTVAAPEVKGHGWQCCLPHDPEVHDHYRPSPDKGRKWICQEILELQPCCFILIAL